MDTHNQTSGSNLDVNQLLQLLKSNNIKNLREFIEQCPSVKMKDTVLDLINDYTRSENILMMINTIGENYSRGIDPQLGITLGKAIYLYSQDLFTKNPSVNTHLYNVGRAALNYVVGLNALGKHEEIISFATEAEEWLAENKYLDMQPSLLLARIEALIDLGHYEEAEALLNQTNWQTLLTGRPGDLMQKESLMEKLKNELLSAVELPSAEQAMSDKEVMIEYRRSLLKDFATMTEIMPPELANMAQEFIEKSQTKEELERKLPDSLAEYAIENQRRTDALIDLASGKSAEDVLQDYLQTIGRSDLTDKLLGNTSTLDDESDTNKQ